MPASSPSAISARVLPTPEKMIFCGGVPGSERAAQFAFGDDVHAGAELDQRFQHRLVGVRLHGVADERVLAGEGLREHAEMPRQGRGGIAIERGFDFTRDLGEVDVLGIEAAVAVFEVLHEGGGSLLSFHAKAHGRRFANQLGRHG